VPTPLKTILVATDFSDPSEAALRYALDLAAALKASVVLLHAYEIPVAGIPEANFVAPFDMAERLAKASQAALDGWVAKFGDRGVPLTGLLKCGDPREAVERAATEAHADLIVLGTHGRRGLSRLLLGSVAEYVVRTASHPVLTIRSAPSAAT
jgi:nucleotide-binding universal stress UspA family protein